jgi:WD40 repeat protein
MLAAPGPGINLWDTTTGRFIRSFQRKKGDPREWYIYSAVFSSDGGQLAIASEPDGNETTVVHVFSLAGESRLPRHHWEVRGFRQPLVRFGRDGKTLVLGGPQEALSQYDVRTGRRLGEAGPAVPKGWGGYVLARHGKQFAARDRDDVYGLPIHIVDVASNRIRVTLRGGVAKVKTLVFSPDGKTLAGADEEEGNICLWDAGTGRLRHEPSGLARVIRQVRFERGQPIAVGVESGEVRFWNVRSGRIVRRLRPGRGKIGPEGCLAISPTGAWLAVCGLGEYEYNEAQSRATRLQTTHLWRLDTGKEIRTWQVRSRYHPYHGTNRPDQHDEPAWSRYRRPELVFSPDSRLLAEVDWEGTLRIRQTATGKEVCRQPQRKQELLELLYSDAFWSPDSKQLAVTARFPAAVAFGGDMGDPRNGSRLLDVSTGKIRRANPTFRDPRWLSPDGSVLLVVNRHISLADAANGRIFRRSSIQHNWSALPPVFSPSGRLLAVGDPPRGCVRVCEVATGQELGVFSGHTAEVTSLAFSPDGKHLLSGSIDGTAVLWNVASAFGDEPSSGKASRGKLLRWIMTLTAPDARQAYRAIWTLARAGDQATGLVARQLLTFEAVESARLRGLLERLGSDDFAQRQKASGELERLGFAAEDGLRELARSNADLEARRRAERLLARWQRGGREQQWQHFVRIVEALEQIGTPAARKALQRLAERGAAIALRQQAKAACRRLERGERQP